MGPGLSLARSIVEAHGGTISAPNQDVGVVFVVVLLREPSSESSEQAGANSQ